jgi:hypothetical protein
VLAEFEAYNPGLGLSYGADWDGDLWIPNISGGTYVDEMLIKALDIAWNKLVEKCGNSFTLPEGISISDLFMSNGTSPIKINFDNLGGVDANGRVEIARTVCVLGTTTEPGGRPSSSWPGVLITINNNMAAPYMTGYTRPDGNPIRPGLDFANSLAVTLIHEFGHAIALMYGKDSSPIVDDKNGSDEENARRSEQNSQWVISNCFN